MAIIYIMLSAELSAVGRILLLLPRTALGSSRTPWTRPAHLADRRSHASSGSPRGRTASMLHGRALLGKAHTLPGRLAVAGWPVICNAGGRPLGGSRLGNGPGRPRGLGRLGLWLSRPGYMDALAHLEIVLLRLDPGPLKGLLVHHPGVALTGLRHRAGALRGPREVVLFFSKIFRTLGRSRRGLLLAAPEQAAFFVLSPGDPFDHRLFQVHHEQAEQEKRQ